MFHDWSDDNPQYEILGLRVLLRESISEDAYSTATPEYCIALGLSEYRRLSALGNARWHKTFDELKRSLGRTPTYVEHSEALLKERQK